MPQRPISLSKWLRSSFIVCLRPTAAAALALSILPACGSKAALGDAQASITNSLAAAYTNYATLPLNVRTELTTAVSDLTFDQLATALGTAPLQALGFRHTTIAAYLKSVHAQPLDLSASAFAKAMHAGSAGKGANSERLRAEVAFNMSIIAILNRLKVAPASVPSTTKASLALAVSTCGGDVPSGLKDAINDWVRDPKSATQGISYAYDESGQLVEKKNHEQRKPALDYRQTSKDALNPEEIAAWQHVTAFGTPDDVTSVSGAYSYASGLHVHNFTQCQQKQIKGAIKAAAISALNTQDMAHLVSTSWAGPGASS